MYSSAIYLNKVIRAMSVPRQVILIFSCLILLRYSYGVGHHYADTHGIIVTSSDSKQFLAGAYSLKETLTYRSEAGGFQFRWPPGFSAATALTSTLLDLPIPPTTVIVLTFSSGLIAAIGFFFLYQIIGTHWLVAFSFSLLLIRSLPIMWVSTRILAGGMFLATVGISLATFFYLVRAPTIFRAVLCGLAIGLTYLTKWNGISVLFAAGLMYLWDVKEKRPLAGRLTVKTVLDRHWLIVFFVSMVPIVLWSLRNSYLGGGAIGNHYPVETGFFQSSLDFYDGLALVFAPTALEPLGQRLFFLIFITAMVFGARYNLELTTDGKIMVRIFTIFLVGFLIPSYIAKLVVEETIGFRPYLSAIMVIFWLVAVNVHTLIRAMVRSPHWMPFIILSIYGISMFGVAVDGWEYFPNVYAHRP